MRMAIVDDVLAEQEIIKKYIIEWASIHNEMIEFRCFENSDSFLFASVYKGIHIKTTKNGLPTY